MPVGLLNWHSYQCGALNLKLSSDQRGGYKRGLISEQEKEKKRYINKRLLLKEEKKEKLARNSTLGVILKKYH